LFEGGNERFCAIFDAAAEVKVNDVTSLKGLERQRDPAEELGHLDRFAVSDSR